MKQKIIDAIECCMNGVPRCDKCPLQEEICDTMYVPHVALPAELVEMIEEALSQK